MDRSLWIPGETKRDSRKTHPRSTVSRSQSRFFLSQHRGDQAPEMDGFLFQSARVAPRRCRAKQVPGSSEASQMPRGFVTSAQTKGLRIFPQTLHVGNIDPHSPSPNG